MAVRSQDASVDRLDTEFSELNTDSLDLYIFQGSEHQRLQTTWRVLEADTASI